MNEATATEAIATEAIEVTMDQRESLEPSNQQQVKKIKTDHESSSDYGAAAVLNKVIVCSRCARSDFTSRNKLFQHLKFCTLDFNPLNRAGPLPAEEFNSQYDAFIYVTGGRIRGKTLGCVERYSFRSSRWETCPALLENRGSHGSTAIGDIVYVIGGGGFRSNLASNEKLQAYSSSATTTTIAATTNNTSAAAATTTRTTSTATLSDLCSAIPSCSWSYVKPMPTSRHALAVIAAPSSFNNPLSSNQQQHEHQQLQQQQSEEQQVIYAIGGWIDGSICSAHVERYCPRSDAWTSCAAMKLGRRLLGVAAATITINDTSANTAYAIDSTAATSSSSTATATTSTCSSQHRECLFVFGGNCDDGVWNTDSVEVYDIMLDQWTEGPKLPVAGQCSAVTVDDFIYVFIHGHFLVRFCPNSRTFTKLNEQLPVKQWFCFDVTTVNKKIYLHGGNIEGVWSNVFFEYDVYSNSWTRLADMSNNRRRCSAAVVLL